MSVFCFWAMSTKQMVAVHIHFQLRDVQLWLYIVRGIKQCCFNSTPDPFNGQTVNFIVKPPKLIESRTYVKKANLENYWNNTVLLLWQHTQLQIIFKNRVKHIVINVKIDNDALLIFKHCFKTLIPSCFKI